MWFLLSGFSHTVYSSSSNISAHTAIAIYPENGDCGVRWNTGRNSTYDVAKLQQPKLEIISNLFCKCHVLQITNDWLKEEKQHNRIHGICKKTLMYVGTNFPFSYTAELKWSTNYSMGMLI